VLPDGKAKVELTTEGGLYIKELLHGDEGRTEPSLSSLLGKEIVVESLDVIGVQYMDQGTGPQEVESHGKEVEGNNGKHPPDI
jgi:tRNA U54 and U55 pseudouridine synthase Pus10